MSITYIHFKVKETSKQYFKTPFLFIVWGLKSNNSDANKYCSNSFDWFPSLTTKECANRSNSYFLSHFCQGSLRCLDWLMNHPSGWSSKKCEVGREIYFLWKPACFLKTCYLLPATEEMNPLWHRQPRTRESTPGTWVTPQQMSGLADSPLLPCPRVLFLTAEPSRGSHFQCVWGSEAQEAWMTLFQGACKSVPWTQQILLLFKARQYNCIYLMATTTKC